MVTAPGTVGHDRQRLPSAQSRDDRRMCRSVAGSRLLSSDFGQQYAVEWDRVVAGGAVDVVARWSGEPGRPASVSPATADSGAPSRRTHEEILREAGFLDVTECRFPTSHAWAVDEFIGFLWSTSYTAPIRQNPALAIEFENDLRAQLVECEPSGQLRESIAHYYILGPKPSAPNLTQGECSAVGSGRAFDPAAGTACIGRRVFRRGEAVDHRVDPPFRPVLSSSRNGDAAR